VPSVSKAQQRFMGLVHAYKKGEVPASKVSKAVKDVAKSMKKKSTKKFASTKHDDLPNKVRSENMNEDGHTDVASAERKLKLIMKDAMDTLNALRNLSNEDSLPSWWTDKITLAKDYVGKSRDYIMNPAESVNEESKTIKSIQNLADKNKYGTVSGTRMNGKTAKEIIAIYNHPKMKSFRGKMDKLKSHELMDLTIRLPKMLGIKVESVNEGKLDRIASQLIKDLDKEFPIGKYNPKKVSDFNKLVKHLKSKMSKLSNVNIGHLATDYHNYRQGQTDKERRPAIKGLVKTLKKLGMKESVNEKVIKVSKKDDIPGNPMKMKGEEKIKKLTYSGSVGMDKPGSYEIKGNKLNVNNIRPRDKGFFVRHFTMGTGFRKANLYYDGVHWQGGKKF
jgi:hypothetical protein